MKHLVNPDVQNIQISGIRQIADKIKTYSDVVSLTIGEPDFQTPLNIKESGKKAIDNNQTFYAPNPGILGAREAASNFLERNYGLTYDLNSEIIVTNGSTEALFIALKTVLCPNDEVIIPTPTYPGYEPVITMCGGKIVPVDVTSTNFKLTKEQLRSAITPQTKALILPYPSNPTGAILTKEEVAELAEVLKDKDIFVLSDELYSELVFEENHVSIAEFPQMREKTIVINGVSKSHAMTGWRVGFTFAPAYLTAEMLKVHQYVNTSVNTIAQEAAIEALYNGQPDVTIMKNAYQSRRDFLCKRLKEIGFDVTVPDGTFYVFPDVSPFSSNSYDFCMDVLENARVGILPSTVFTYGGKQHVRISFAYSMEKLEEAMNRLETYLQKKKGE